MSKRKKLSDANEFLIPIPTDRFMGKDRFISNGHALTVEQIDEWLTTLHCTLWQSWDITKPARRRLAAEWVLDLYHTLQKLEQS